MGKERENANKPTFIEWFNPDDIEHIYAYHVLQNTGMWPKGFVPEEIYMNPHWNMFIQSKLADKWIDHKLSNELRTNP